MLTKKEFESIKPQVEKSPIQHWNDPMGDGINRPKGREYDGTIMEATSIDEFNNLMSDSNYELKGSFIYDNFTDGSAEHYGIIFWKRR